MPCNMQPHALEIKVALLGHVSVGKSTVINALLRGKYAEVGMRRTTAGVNFFRLHPKESKWEDVKQESPANKSKEEISADGGMPSSPPQPTAFHDSAFTFEKISEANADLRANNQIKESTFDIEIDEPLCRMRDDTTLVLIDIPGLNEAGSKDVYRAYVEAQWTTFDCVIAVMDVFQGVNTEEQIQLLKLIEKNLRLKKTIPVIVLCNKVDDFENDEAMMLVDEVRSKVEDIFRGNASVSAYSTAFVPLSAEKAFVYRTASDLTFPDFEKLDKELVDKIGHDEIPKSKWRQLTQDERYQAAFEAVSCKSTCEGSLKATNFQSFIGEFKRFLEGDDVQLNLLMNQVEVMRRSLSFDRMIASDLQKICDFHRVLGRMEASYAKDFWGVYSPGSNNSLETFKTEANPRCLHAAMSQLVEYGEFVKRIGGGEKENEKIVRAMESLLRLQIGTLVKHANASEWDNESKQEARLRLYDWDDTLLRWRLDLPQCTQCVEGVKCADGYHLNLHPVYIGTTESDWQRDGANWKDLRTGTSYGASQYDDIRTPPSDCPHHWVLGLGNKWRNKFTKATVLGEHNPCLGKVLWSNLSPYDVCTIAESMLLLSYSNSFCDHFGREKVLLESIVDECKNKLRNTEQPLRNALEGSHNLSCDFIPRYPDKYSIAARIEMPRRLSDPAHWGYLAWQFCQYMDVKACN